MTPRCRLRGVLGEALAAFVATLDRYTLADLVLKPEDFGIVPSTEGTAKPARRRFSETAS